MTRTVEVDMTTYCKKAETAFNRFFKKYPELEFDWREAFEWMYENKVDSYCDNLLADGKVNRDWNYSLSLDVDDDRFYMAIVLRE